MIRTVSIFTLLLLVVSCTPKENIADLQLPFSAVISRELRVALVIDPYIALRDQPGDTGITIAHARRGDVFIVSGKQFLDTVSGRSLWFNLGNGWVVDSSVQLYSSEARARAAGTE
ncbi:MAG TPA: hypothetical protein GXZ47_06375 [Treponema sp.]|nr:hypothetical protein [Treponema sp.]